MFGPKKMYRLTEREKNAMFNPNMDPNLTILQEQIISPKVSLLDLYLHLLVGNRLFSHFFRFCVQLKIVQK